MKRVFSDDELEEVRKETGQRLRTEGDKPYVPRKDVPAVVEAPMKTEKPAPADNSGVMAVLLTVAKSNEANMAAVLANQEAMISVVQEMNKPKPKKKWHCPIQRNLKGEMTAVDIEEL